MLLRSRAGYRSARPIISRSSHSACNARPVHTDGQERYCSVQGPDTEAQDQSSPDHHIRLATHGRSIQKCHNQTTTALRANVSDEILQILLSDCAGPKLASRRITQPLRPVASCDGVAAVYSLRSARYQILRLWCSLNVCMSNVDLH